LRIFLFAVRKPQDGMKYKIVLQANIRPKPLSTVLNAPMPHHPQADFGCLGTTLETGSYQAHPPYTQTVPLYMFLKLCSLASELLAHYNLQTPTSLTDLVYSHIQTQTLK
jgi:hypothetical protein